MARLAFVSDYMEGAHPAIMKRLVETNLEQTSGYGADEYSEAARAKIREACEAPNADVFFLVGGTQTNATVIDALLHSYQGVVAADTGHIAVHEAGAIEFSGHKVMTLPQKEGTITAAQVEALLDAFDGDANRDHMVMPGMVYISHPTEQGTLYSLAELTALSQVCRAHDIPLYMDGARLAYALACPENDVTLPDIARLCDAFYIGGTKCGALLGEAVVFPRHNLVPHFFTIVKQHGALLAKGRMLGIQFDTLFTDGLYGKIGESAIHAADRIRAALTANGFELVYPSPTNQVFTVVSDDILERLSRDVDVDFWEKADASHTVIRFATSWATREADVDALCEILANVGGPQ